MDSSRKHDNPSPERTTNFLSKVFFCWIVPLFWTGYKYDLQMKDVYNTTDVDKCGPLADELQKHWDEEMRRTNGKKETPSLKKAIFKTFVKPYSMYGILFFFQAVIFKSMQPIFLAEFIKYFQDKETYDEKYGDKYGWIMGSAIIFSSFGAVVLFHHAQLGCQRVGMRIRATCCSLVYRKLLKLSQASLGQTAAGKLVNLLSNDLQRFDQAAVYLHYFWLMPLQAVIAFYIMYRSVGLAALAGMIVMMIEALPLQGYLSKLQGKLRLKIAERTDYRVKLMNEIVSGIKVIKTYAWEKSFARVVENVRKQEINVISKTSYIRGFSLSLMVFTERLALFLTLITFVLLGNLLTSDVVFSMAQMYNSIQLFMCIYYPHCLAQYAESKVSIKRLEQFLALEENGSRAVLNSTDDRLGKPGAIRTEKATASWSLYPVVDTLTDINININAGTLCCVVGNVGAGKSSLLQMLLKELPLNCGKVDVAGEVSYASQEPWLFVSSVKENILFGRPYVKEKYDEVIRVCALETDLQQFPFGDRTPVEERGVSLSGGQRARINLARAVYAEADIYLFDDPLSAVDTQVGKHLFELCIKDYLRDKTRMLVTHQLQFLKQADVIIIISEGRIKKIGTYDELSVTELTSLYPESGQDDKVHEAETGKKQHVDNQIENYIENDDEPEENLEAMGTGAIPASTYTEYYRHGASVCLLIFLVFLLIFAQMCSNAADLWVTYWTNLLAESNRHHNSTELSDDDLTTPTTDYTSDYPDLGTTTSSFNAILENSTFHDYYASDSDDFVGSRDFYIVVYSVFIGASILLTPARSFLFYRIVMNASKGLHKKMFAHVLAAPMRFFDTNPSGRILNRFSTDMGIIDELLPKAILEAVQVFLVMSGILTLVFICTPWIIGPTVLLGFLFYFFRVVYLKTAQDVKRLEGISRAPVFSHISASLYGISTIRSSKAEQMVIREFDVLQDQHTSTWYLYITSSEAFGFYLDCISTIFLALVTYQFLLFSESSVLSGNVGLVISQSMVLTGMLQIGVRQTAEVASNMTSIERVLQYTKLEKEDKHESAPSKNSSKEFNMEKFSYTNPEMKWPQTGKIVFRNTYVRYSPEAQPVLRNLNLEVASAEKVGIVGRTGAGKSTLISALFRLAPIDGCIFIDDVDTSTIKLQELRSNISIIPQEPVLFSATVRYNLDPFEKVSDDVLWAALEDVELKDAVENLDQLVSEGGTNFSAGQRQLLCLARAIVRNNKILVMDEATANVDPYTDSLIQKTIRENFKHCTVLTIAHRLNTIMDSDKVLVMRGGEAVEFAHPHELLQDPEGHFSKMLNQTGPAMELSLRNIARNDYNKKFLRGGGRD